MQESLVASLYNDLTIGQWQHEATMQHSSGIWGREPVLTYLEQRILRRGQTVVDLGAGAGYPSWCMSRAVAPDGQVIGIELSEAMLVAARRHCQAENLLFKKGDVGSPLPVPSASADVVTAFMVMHNLHTRELKTMLAETRRILSPEGRAVFLTMHPRAFDSDWDLEFLSYERVGLLRSASANEREDMEIPGLATNNVGGENRITTIYHSRAAVLDAAAEAGLNLSDEADLWIDRDTAAARFGVASIRRLPATPVYWMVVFKRAHDNDET